jgi:hypothetical protein
MAVLAVRSQYILVVGINGHINGHILTLLGTNANLRKDTNN